MFEIAAQQRRVKKVMRKAGLTVAVNKSSTTNSVYVFGRNPKVTFVVRVSDHRPGQRNTQRFNISIHPGGQTIASVSRLMKKIANYKPKPKRRKR